MKNLLRLLRYAKPYWGLLSFTVFCLLAMISVNLVTPWLIRELIAILTEQRLSEDSLKAVWQLAAILFSITVARAFFRFLHNYLSHKAAWNLVSDMRVIVYDHLQKLSLRYYHDKQTGQLMSRATNDTATFEALIAHALPEFLANMLVLGGVTVMLFVINPTLALLSCIPIPFLGLGALVFMKRIRPNFRQAQSTLADLNATLQDNISGMKEIQVFNQQKDERERVTERSKSYVTAILRALKMSALFHPTIEALSQMGTVIVVGAGGYLALRGSMTVADIIGFLLYLSIFYGPMATIGRVMEDLQQSLAGAERVFEVLDTESDVQDGEGAVSLGRARGDVAFHEVSFHYVNEKPVLDKVSFEAPAGKMIALVGPTGVGKTTVISLLARFYDPVSGFISIDGHDIRSLTLSSLRDQVSIVLQDVFLFSGTIAENIAYGNRKATREDIERAARIARADDFIRELPEGYDALIGERGIKLSGGQKQRLAIARAVLRDTPILIFDEATASVDVETEKKIQQAIQEIAGTRTILVIAHRLSTVKRADAILVVENGRISESGTHRQLIRKGGAYKKLCDVQFNLDADE